MTERQKSRGEPSAFCNHCDHCAGRALAKTI